MEIVYPGPGEIDATNVIEREPGGALVGCAPSATLVASPGASPIAGG